MKQPRPRKWAKWAKWGCTIAAGAAVGLLVFSLLFGCNYATASKKPGKMWLVSVSGAALLVLEQPDWSRGRFPQPMGWQAWRANALNFGFTEDDFPARNQWEWWAGIRYRNDRRGL